MPSKPLNKQYHKVELKLPDGFLGTLGSETMTEGIPKARIAGAVAAGAGAYLMTRVFQKTFGDVLRDVVGAVDPITQYLADVFGGTPRFQPGVEREKEEILALDPFAVSMGLIVGGMILADQNPGEVLKGIGEIIPG